MKVTVLFKKSVREEIRATVAQRQDGYQLPAEFDTQGQVFEHVIDITESANFVTLHLANAAEPDMVSKIYSYQATDIARFKVEY